MGGSSNSLKSSISAAHFQHSAFREPGHKSVVVQLGENFERQIADNDQRLSMAFVEYTLGGLVLKVTHAIAAAEFIENNQRGALNSLPKIAAENLVPFAVFELSLFGVAQVIAEIGRSPVAAAGVVE